MRLWTMAVVGLGLSLSALTTANAQESDWEEKPYIIEDGKVDYGTYNGYRRYHNTCHVCHGPDALGSSFAPSLTESLKTMSYTDFLEVVTNGRQAKGAANQDSVMPSFAENSDVMLYIDHIYAYLKARADDAVGRGRPERLPPEEDQVFQEWKDSQ
ncbi:c-type cytochrome [Chelativorans salis]|uniref:C-type cytochrome n=1 Tax=Chelativorans salis TaxID=2978478 RepID=A0ABT2LIS5_9HYPH|nr:c-type cytochrome [Chelativorans sp. EGI FJ00035]MCT7374282.1 c-type cytochrome [Chelativorans sp. EGI FJ00035]